MIAAAVQGLGEAFADDVKRAWTTVYGVLSTTMIAVAQDASAQHPSEAVA